MSLPGALRAAILLAVVLDAPVASAVVRRLTSTPRTERADVDGVPVEVVRPAGEAARPAWVFVNGAHPLRRREPVVTRLVEGLARAGFVVIVPDVPGLGEGAVTSRTVAATRAVVSAAVARRDVRGGRVALVGASTGAGLALLAAGSEPLAARISIVAAVAPFANLRKLVCLTTTSTYDGGDGSARYEVTDLHRFVVARSLVAALPRAGEGEALLAELAEIERDALNPLEELPRRADERSADARAVLALLGNRDPSRFDRLFDALPPSVRAFVDEVSPLTACQRIEAPVEIVVPPLDTYFPPGEARALAEALPHAHLTVTRALDHTRPRASLGLLTDFARLYGFAARGLATAARAGSATP